MNKLLALLKANRDRGKFRADAATNEIYLYDMIAGTDLEAEYWGGTSPKQFIDQLAGMKGDVSVHINSPGGDVFGGQAICEAIRQHDGTVTAYVDGVAASIASVIAVACDKVVMAPGALMMIHKAWTISLGNADDMKATAALLEKVDGLIADGYAAKSGKEAKNFAQMMADESWLTASEAKDLGLSDETSESKKDAGDAAKNAAKWDLSAFANAPKLKREKDPDTGAKKLRQLSSMSASGIPNMVIKTTNGVVEAVDLPEAFAASSEIAIEHDMKASFRSGRKIASYKAIGYDRALDIVIMQKKSEAEIPAPRESVEEKEHRQRRHAVAMLQKTA